LNFNSFLVYNSGNRKEEPGAIVCRVAQSFIRFGSYQIHASRGKEDLKLIRQLADYTIKHHFPHLENLQQSNTLSFDVPEGDSPAIDLTSNKYAGNVTHMIVIYYFTCVFCSLVVTFQRKIEKILR
jgi:uncharacterized protein YdiU (UPF0061 family)